MKKVFFIVLTGGPCSGKSDILKALGMHFLNDIVCMPEVSETLLSSGIVPIPNAYPGWQKDFQDMICPMQLKGEHMWMSLARSQGKSIVVCDRGALDGAAYWKGGQSKFCEDFKLGSPNDVFSRYLKVIHLRSLVVTDKDAFEELRTKKSNRFETTEKTVELENTTLMAWDGHKDRPIINGEKKFTDKILAVIKHIESVLSFC
jgi:hypothetical protein